MGWEWLTSASPVWQQAATLEPQACWMGTATGVVVSGVHCVDGCWNGECKHTDGDGEAVQADEVLAAVAAGELLAVAALGAVGLGVNVDLGVLVGGTLGEGNSGHGGDDERLEEGHFEGVGLV